MKHLLSDVDADHRRGIAQQQAMRQQAQDRVAEAQTAMQQLAACGRSVYDAPEFAPLRRHLPFNAGSPSVEQLADNSIPSVGEVHLVLQAHAALGPCKERALEALSRFAPEQAAVAREVTTANEDALVPLVQRQETWGDYNRQARNLVLAGNAKHQAMAAQSRQAQEQALERESRASRAAASRCECHPCLRS